MWGDPDFQALSPHAKLVLLAMMTGSQSNLAGIAFEAPEALARETRLSSPEIEAALSELEKAPRPGRSFVVRDAGVIWVRRQLADDPARDSDPNCRNVRHRTAMRPFSEHSGVGRSQFRSSAITTSSACIPYRVGLAKPYVLTYPKPYAFLRRSEIGNREQRSDSGERKRRTREETRSRDEGSRCGVVGVVGAFEGPDSSDSAATCGKSSRTDRRTKAPRLYHGRRNRERSPPTRGTTAMTPCQRVGCPFLAAGDGSCALHTFRGPCWARIRRAILSARLTALTRGEA